MSSGKSEFCTLMGSFCQNHVQFQLKKYRRVSMALKSDEKFKEKLACSFKHDKEFGEFSPSHSKV